jgi:hypothetical protein
MAKADEPNSEKAGVPATEPVPAEASQPPAELYPIDEELPPPELIPIDEELPPAELYPIDEELAAPEASLLYEAQAPPERVAAELPARADSPAENETLPAPVVPGVTPKGLVSQDVLKSVWRAEAGDGRACAVIALSPDRSGPEEEAFRNGAHKLLKLTRKRPHPSLLRVTAVSDDGRACVTDLWTVGTVADLPALGWDLDRRLKVFRSVCGGLAALHAVGIVHGCLRPANILLDDDLAPVIADAGMFDIALSLGGDPDGSHGFGPYASPEARFGMAMDARADVFSIGCLLHFLLLENDPPECADAVPRLDSIAAHAPAGLVRIVRKCVVADADQRYAGINDLVADLDKYAKYEEVGVAHPEVKETNLTTEFAIQAARESRTGPAEHAPIPLKPRAQSATAEALAVRSERQYVTPRTLLLIGAAGVAITVGCVAYAYTGSVGGLFGRVAMGVGVALATALIPLEIRHENEVRGGIALAVLAIMIALDPVAGAAKGGASERLRSKDRAASVEAVKKLLAAGEADLTNAQLRNADLSGLNFSNARLDFANLAGANVQNADFSGASLAEAWIVNANFTGAKMNGVRQFDSAHCNGGTTMPAGWQCVDDRPVPGSASP